MSNLAKDTTKKELYTLVLVAGMISNAGLDKSWLEIYGNDIIDSAENMAEKLLQHQNAVTYATFEEGADEAVTEESEDVANE